MRKMRWTTIGLILWTAAATCLGRPAPKITLTVSAGDWNRRDSVVTFFLPEDARQFTHVQSADGVRFPIQIDRIGYATFVVDRIRLGTTRSFRLVTLADTEEPAVQATPGAGHVRFSVAGTTVFQYQAEKSALPREDLTPIFQRGGYIHPVFSPDGHLVTDDYPRKHKHHHGIWFPWTKTEFEGRHPDFWNMGEGTGTVEFAGLDQVWSGPVHAGLTARHRFVDLSGGGSASVLNETWELRLYRQGRGGRPYWMFDLVSTQQCATASALRLVKNLYGGLGVRGHAEWDGAPNARFLTSEGETNRVTGNSQRARWCYMGGRVQGALAGLAILDYPENFRSPQPMRLHPDEPFFCYAPVQIDDFEIVPGRPYISRYRFIVFDGAPDREWLDRLWDDFADPPKATLQIKDR